MAYRNLNEFIDKLEKAGQLVRIREFVNPVLEMSEITDRITKSDGMALLFENNGTGFPVLMNAMGSDVRICMALGINDLNEPGRELEDLLKEITSPKSGVFEKIGLLGTLRHIADWMPRLRKGKGECQQIVMEKPDLSKLPVITCWPHDGGPFITLPLVHTQDPHTGMRNLGMYRMQVFDQQTTGMHWHLHKNSARHYREYKALGKKMPVTVTLGGDPAYTYAATAPLPDNVDEYLLAGFLRKRKVELVKCLTNDLEVPSDVDFVIEGYVDPQEELILEGPFGDHTGFYSLADYYPSFHVTCITHRKNAVYPATIVGIPPQEDAWLGKATERIFLAPIRMAVLPEIKDMYMPKEGVFHNIAIVSIKKEYDGHAAKVMNSLWGAGQMMFNKVMIVTDENVDIHNPDAVLKVVSENVLPERDLYFSRGPADVLDHSSNQFAFGGKLGFDATGPLQPSILMPITDCNKIMSSFVEITDINTKFIQTGIPILMVFLIKNRSGHVKEVHNRICKSEHTSGIKYIIYYDAEAIDQDSSSLVWIAANHIDPGRDCFIEKSCSGHFCLGIDATRKNREFNGFEREWPNPVVMDESTINTVDNKWNSLNLGPLLISPSLKYKKLVNGNSAVAGKDSLK